MGCSRRAEVFGFINCNVVAFNRQDIRGNMVNCFNYLCSIKFSGKVPHIKEGGIVWFKSLLIILLLLSLVFLLASSYAVSNGNLTAEKRIELLSCIKEMRQELNNINQQLQTSQINLNQANEQLKLLKNQYQEQIQLSETLQNQSEELKKSLDEWKQLSTDLNRQIISLKFQRNIAVIITIAALIF